MRIEHVLFRHTRRDNAFKTTARVKDLYIIIYIGTYTPGG